MNQQRGELVELVELAIADQISPMQSERLESMLIQPENQAIYTCYLEMHASLHWQARFQVAPIMGAGLFQETALLDRTKPIDRSITVIRQLPKKLRWQFSERRYLWVLAMGLTALVLAGGWWAIDLRRNFLGGNSMGAIHGNSNGRLASEERMVLARVTGTKNSRWANDGGVVEFGYDSPLHAGQRIKLTQGLAEVTFTSGVKVVLEAPVELDVAAYNESFLHGGRMTAMVPDGAEGFKVGMEGLTIIDRGTEFGLMAKENGLVEVHVFKGLVEGHFGEEWGQQQGFLEWPQDTTVTIDPAEHVIQHLSESPIHFVRSFSSNSPGSGLLAKEDFEYSSAPLAALNGGFGWGSPWSILSTQGDPSIVETIAEGSLKYKGLFNSGNRAALTGGFERIRRTLNTSIGGVFDAAGYIEDQDGARLIGRDETVLFLSFVQRVNSLGQEFYGLELNRGDGNRNRVLCFGHGAHLTWVDGPPRTPNRDSRTTGWSVTSEFNGPDRNTLLELGSLGEESTEPVLVVVKIEFGQNNTDTVTAYVNPASLTDESQCEPKVFGIGDFAFDQVSLANFGGFKTFELDHMRIGRTFAAVTAPSFELLDVASSTP